MARMLHPQNLPPGKHPLYQWAHAQIAGDSRLLRRPAGNPLTYGREDDAAGDVALQYQGVPPLGTKDCRPESQPIL